MADSIYTLHNGFDISLNSRSNATSIRPEHLHNYYEIYYLSAGKATHFMDSEILKLQAGDLVLIEKGLIHKTIYEVGEFSERILVCFTEEFIGTEYQSLLKELGSRKYFSLSAPKQLDVKSLLKKIYSEYSKKQSEYLKMCKNLLGELLIALYRQHPNEQEKPLSGNESVIQSAAKYIAENFSEPLTLPSLAARYAMSPSYFSKTFKALTGFGVNEYINITRIAEAENLLLSGCLSITETAARCGFNDSNYFAAVFKKKKGITPYKFSAINRQK